MAVNMYKQLGYSVYRTVIEYYSASNGEPDEDAYGEPPSAADPQEDAETLTFILQTGIFHYFNKFKSHIFWI